MSSGCINPLFLFDSNLVSIQLYTNNINFVKIVHNIHIWYRYYHGYYNALKHKNYKFKKELPIECNTSFSYVNHYMI